MSLVNTVRNISRHIIAVVFSVLGVLAYFMHGVRGPIFLYTEELRN